MHRPRKRFGQNFLKDPLVLNNIVNAISPKKEDHILEIGPGLGALTSALVESGIKRLDCLEIDRDLVEILNQSFASHDNFHIINQDALTFDLHTLPQINTKKLRVVGNLPYNISTPLLFHLLDFCPLIQDMHFMLQKEVVDRLTAEPNTKSFGRLSLMIQYFCKTQFLFTVEPQAFSPAPKVTSAFIRLIPYDVPPYQVNNFDLFKTLTHLAFTHRRKMLSNILKSYLHSDDFEKIGLDERSRPENLSLEQWVKLSNYIDKEKS